MTNTKVTNILLGILIIAIIIIGIILIKNQSQKDEIIGDSLSSESADFLDDASVPTPRLDQMVGYDGAPLASATSKTFDWKTVSPQSVWNIIQNDSTVFFEKDFGIGMTDTMDLNGDGNMEAIFSGNGGNNGASVVVMNNQGTLSLAQQKAKDGRISSVYMVSVGRVMVSEGYKFLPAEKGYYTVSKSYNESTDKFNCNTNGVAAYQWNLQTKLFEWNATMTAKYTAIECN